MMGCSHSLDDKTHVIVLWKASISTGIMHGFFLYEIPRIYICIYIFIQFTSTSAVIRRGDKRLNMTYLQCSYTKSTVVERSSS